MKAMLQVSLPVLIGLLLAASGCAVYPDRDDPDAAGTGGMTIGQACDEDADCGDDYACLIGPPDGYCVLTGAIDCFYDTECPADTVCAPLTLSERPGLCLLTCENQADCRSGYLCTVAELFPGDQTSPRSSEKVCWLPCFPGANQLCNDDPLISSLHGTCKPDYTCACNDGAQPNPVTGRCR